MKNAPLTSAINRTFLLLIALLCFQSGLHAQPSRHTLLLPFYYQSQQPIELDKIAEKYGVSTHQLKSWNRLTGDGMLPANTRIIACFIVEKRKKSGPVTTSERAIKTDFGTFDRIYHQVVSQEYLLDIAEAYDANIHQIQEWNGGQMRNVNVIVPGQQVLVGFEFMDERPVTQLVAVTPEAGTAETEETPKQIETIRQSFIPIWVFIVMAVLLLGIVGLVVFIFMNKKKEKEQAAEDDDDEEEYDEDEEEDDED